MDSGAWEGVERGEENAVESGGVEWSGGEGRGGEGSGWSGVEWSVEGRDEIGVEDWQVECGE